ncbi:MAG: hypothetical protein OWQ50_08935 [Acidianus infernus]|nr:hypothetical protein [Acidianus infernus]
MPRRDSQCVNLRKKADYSKDVITAEDARKAFEHADRILKILEKLEERVK